MIANAKKPNDAPMFLSHHDKYYYLFFVWNLIVLIKTYAHRSIHIPQVFCNHGSKKYVLANFWFCFLEFLCKKIQKMLNWFVTLLCFSGAGSIYELIFNLILNFLILKVLNIRFVPDEMGSNFPVGIWSSTTLLRISNQ